MNFLSSSTTHPGKPSKVTSQAAGSLLNWPGLLAMAGITRGSASGKNRRDIPPEILAEYLLGMLRTRSWELEDRSEPLRSQALLLDLFTKGAGLREQVGT